MTIFLFILIDYPASLMITLSQQAVRKLQHSDLSQSYEKKYIKINIIHTLHNLTSGNRKNTFLSQP